MSDEYFGNFYLGPQTRNGNSRLNPVPTFNNLFVKERLLNSIQIEKIAINKRETEKK